MTTGDQGDDRPVALITGGGTGIGAAVAHRLASSHRVVVCGRRPGPLEEVASATGGLAIPANIGDPGVARSLPGQVADRLGRLDALVLNAGIVRSASVAAMALDDWTAQLAVNLTAPFVLAQAALPFLLPRKGAIVTVSSVAALRSGWGMAAYSAAKAGVTALTQAIAFENARFGLRANVVAPGWVRTEMADMEMAAAGDGDPEAAYRSAVALVPQRRTATPPEIAEAIAWLVSPQASYVNGATLVIDGGGSIVDAGLAAFDQ